MAESVNYESLIDQDVWAFIRRVENFYPADTAQRSTAEQREIYTNMCKAFSYARPAGIVAEDGLIDSIPVRRYTAANPDNHAHIIFAHGGGFVVGDLDSHDDVCAELCNTTGLGVTAVDYRLAPEHKHPAAFDDCLAVTIYEAQRLGSPVLLCGDSAGGTLCASVAHHLRDSQSNVAVAGQVLIYPALGGGETESYLTHANAPMLTSKEMEIYSGVRTDGPPPTNDPSFAPLADTNFSDLPKTVVLSAECDPLCDDGRLYCDAINNAGGQAQWRCEKGLVHSYLRARHTSVKAKASFKAMTDALSNLAR